MKTKHFYTLYKYNDKTNDIRYIKEYANINQALKDLREYYSKSNILHNITTSLEDIKVLKYKSLVLFKN